VTLLQIDLKNEEKINLLVFLSGKMGISAEEIFSLYLILGDKIFFLFDLFQGKSVKFPSMRSFHQVLSLVDDFKLVKLKKFHYLINGVDSYRDGIKRGDVVRVEGNDVVALSSPYVIAEDVYFICKVKE